MTLREPIRAGAVRLRTLLCGWLLLCLAATAFAADKVLDIGRTDLAPVSLTEYFSTFEDPSGQLELSDVLSEDAAGRFEYGHRAAQALEFGYTHSAWWLRLALRNETDAPAERMIELAYSRLTHVDFYAQTDDRTYRRTQTGSMEPFATRPYANRNFVFPVTLPPHAERTYYFRVQASSALLVPATLWRPDAFRAHERSDYMWQAVYFGMVLAIGLYNLLLFLVLRDVLYLQYVALVAGIAFSIASHNGLVKEFVAADSPLWSQSSASIGFVVSIALMLLFMRHMLRTWIVLPRVDRVLKALIFLNLLPVPLALAVSHQLVIYPLSFLSNGAMTLAIGVGIYQSFRRQRSAYFFTIAYLILFLAAVGLLPPFTDAGASAQIGSAAEMLLLALALADRFNQMRLEKEKAQQEAADAQAKVVDNLREFERTLERRVAQRTAELRQFIDMLSHEVKTPMSVIRMCLGMENASPAIKRHARQSVEDIDGIVERCLQADRIEHGAPVLHRAPCRVDAMLVDLCTASADPARIALHCPDMPAMDTDVQLFSVVVSNLIDNALKYAAPDSEICVEAGEEAEDGRPGIRVRVANAPGAAGLPDPARIFEKYYRSPGAHGKSGSGLGLYIVQRMTNLLGGTIRYRPTDSQIVFELWIPR